jgi:hypothetical protein
MYKKQSRIISSVSSLDNYIDGADIYNSEFLLRLSDPTLERDSYEITTMQYRPDLVAKEYYGDEKYLGILLLQSARNLADFKKGAILQLLPKKTIDSIIGNL